MVVEGIGSNGIIFSSPRIPLENENYNDIKKLNQISKILYLHYNNNYKPVGASTIEKEFININKIILKYPNIFNNDNFILPISGGYINKKEFIEYYDNKNYNYGFRWLSYSEEYLKIFNELMNGEESVFQIIYDRGEKINYKIIDFLIKINDVLNTIIISNKNGFYFDDIKFYNLIVHENKIKIIDFAAIINMNKSLDNIKKQIKTSKFHDIFYYPYNIISNILLYEYIGKYNDINYLQIIIENSIRYKKQMYYKNHLFDILIKLWNTIIPKLTIGVKIINHDLLNKFDNKKLYDVVNIDIDILKSSINTIYNECNKYKDIDIYIYELEHDINISKNNYIYKIFILMKKYVDITKKDTKEKISFLLENLNIHSFGIIFLSYIAYEDNMYNILLLQNKQIIINLIEIIISCCLNFIIIDNKIYLIHKDFEYIQYLTEIYKEIC